MTRVLVVANERIRPEVNGGRVRMAAVVAALGARFDVRVHEPSSTRRTLLPLQKPRLGVALFEPFDVGDCDAVLYTHSYLEPVAPRLDVPVVVDFQNLEVDRQGSFASRGPIGRRAVAAVEAAKARRWEPAVARRAALCVAVTDADADVLRSWGATRVVVVPNAANVPRCPPSPADGPVTFLANVGYGPNRSAAERLRRGVWPLVLRHRPDATLRIAGRGTGDEIDDIGPVLAAASMIVAPVTEGAGTQLKVVEALAAGRVVVATPHSAASAPPGARGACLTAADDAAMAATIVRLLDDVEERHRREQGARVPTWNEATVPLLDAIEALW